MHGVRGPVYTKGHKPLRTKYDQGKGLMSLDGFGVIKIKKWANGAQHSGPSGKNLKPGKIWARAIAQRNKTYRTRSQGRFK